MQRNVINSIILVLLITFTHFSFSQNISKGTIMGNVIDVQSNKPVQYATISLFRSSDSTLVTGTISDSLGVFSIQKIRNGGYFLKINSLGYKSKVIENIMLSAEKEYFNAGSIEIEIDFLAIGEVEIIGEKKIVVLKPDRKIIQVENAISSSGGSAAEVLQLIPEIKVDQNSITLKNQSFTVLVNGKPSGITPSQLLQFPASSIDQIEVITNPSVKYNPQGLGGIVNLKLKKREIGLNSVFQLSAGSDNSYNCSGTLNYGTSKVNFFSSFIGNYYNGLSVGFLEATVLNKSHLLETFESEHNLMRYNIKAGFDIELNSNNHISFFWSQPKDFGKYSMLSKTEKNINETMHIYQSEVLNVTNFIQNDFSFNYSYLIPNKEKDTELSINVLHSRGSQKEEYEPLILSSIPSEIKKRYSLTPKDMSLTTDIECNLIMPISTKIEIEGGVNAIITRETHEISGKTFEFNSQSWQDSLSIRNIFNFNETVVGSFLLLSSFIGDFNVQLGARGEYTFLETLEDKSNDYNNRNYPSFFASAGLTYSPTKKIDLGFSYSNRIERPNALQLNPFVFIGDHLSEQYMGNPTLKPAYTNSFEMSFIHNWEKVSLNSSLSYMKSDDVIDKFFYITDNSIKIKTWSNVSKVKNYILSSSLNWRISKRYRTNISGSFYKKDYFSTINSNPTNSNFGYDIRYISRINFGNDFLLNLFIIYYGPTYYNNYKREQMLKLSLTARKSFSKNFIVSLRINDILNSKTRYSDWGTDYTSISEINNNYRAIYIGLLYKFGKDIKTKSKIDLNTREIKMQRD